METLNRQDVGKRQNCEAKTHEECLYLYYLYLYYFTFRFRMFRLRLDLGSFRIGCRLPL